MGIFYAFWLCSCAARVGEGDQVVFVGGLGVKSVPAMVSMVAVVAETLEDCFVELAA